MPLRYVRHKPSSAYFGEFRIEIEAVNDAPRVHLPGQVYHRNFSVVWPDTEGAEIAFTQPLFTDEDTPLDVPSVSISGKMADARHPKIKTNALIITLHFESCYSSLCVPCQEQNISSWSCQELTVGTL